MRKLILSAAVVLFSTAAIAQEQANPAKGVAPAAMKTSDDITDAKRKLSGELKNSLMLADQLMRKAKSLSGEAKPEEQHVKMVETITNLRGSLSEQLTLVNQATSKDSKEVFAKGEEVNAAASEQLLGFKKELMPEGK